MVILAVAGVEGREPFMSFFHADSIKGMNNVEFRENLGFG